jgi:intracellular multiplication protein IcmN
VRTSYKIISVGIIGLVVMFVLNSCRRSDYTYVPDPPKLPCKVPGACDATIAKYLVRFNKRGVKTITMGQDYLISIPASFLFADQSPRLTWGSYSLLNEVATFMKQFRKIAVTVTSYSSKYVSVQRERALTLARSRVVAEYLWSQGVDSRFMFAQGLGSEKPIIAMRKGGDRSANARVEITFRRAVA